MGHAARPTAITSAAMILGRRGGTTRAGRMTPAQRQEACRVAAHGRWIERPVRAVLHDATTGRVLDGWPTIGYARTWTEAIRLVREAGYRVPSRRTPGYLWSLIPAEVASTSIDGFGVPTRG